MRMRGSVWSKVLSAILLLAILGGAGILIYTISTPAVGERFTEFYILGPGGKAIDYPKDLVVGGEAEVIVGIINREQELMNYRVDVVADGAKINEVGPIMLGHNDKFEQKVGFTMNRPGKAQKVEFLLYKQGQTQVYQSLYLRVNVISK